MANRNWLTFLLLLSLFFFQDALGTVATKKSKQQVAAEAAAEKQRQDRIQAAKAKTESTVESIIKEMNEMEMGRGKKIVLQRLRNSPEKYGQSQIFTADENPMPEPDKATGDDVERAMKRIEEKDPGFDIDYPFEDDADDWLSDPDGSAEFERSPIEDYNFSVVGPDPDEVLKKLRKDDEQFAKLTKEAEAEEREAERLKLFESVSGGWWPADAEHR